jgi:hypothetical protein
MDERVYGGHNQESIMYIDTFKNWCIRTYYTVYHSTIIQMDKDVG